MQDGQGQPLTGSSASSTRMVIWRCAIISFLTLWFNISSEHKIFWMNFRHEWTNSPSEYFIPNHSKESRGVVPLFRPKHSAGHKDIPSLTVDSKAVHSQARRAKELVRCFKADQMVYLHIIATCYIPHLSWPPGHNKIHSIVTWILSKLREIVVSVSALFRNIELIVSWSLIWFDLLMKQASTQKYRRLLRSA